MISIGMNSAQGQAISDESHLQQSINHILTTPVGSRVMRREFGSLLPDLIDQPFNDNTVVLVYAATATALLLHEPRLKLTRVTLSTDPNSPGAGALQIDGVSNFDGRPRPTSVSVPLSTGSQL